MCCRSLSMYARAHVICSHQYTCIYCPCPHPLHTHTATPPPSTRSDLQLRLFGPHATHPDQPFRQPRRRLTPLVRFLFLVICMVCACACAPPLPPTHTRTRAHTDTSRVLFRLQACARARSAFAARSELPSASASFGETAFPTCL